MSSKTTFNGKKKSFFIFPLSTKNSKMEKKRGGDSELAVDLTDTKVARTNGPAEEVDSLESEVVKPIAFMSMMEIEAFVRRTPEEMVLTTLYNYYVVLKYLLGAKFAGADLFLGYVYNRIRLSAHTPPCAQCYLLFLA